MKNNIVRRHELFSEHQKKAKTSIHLWLVYKNMRVWCNEKPDDQEPHSLWNKRLKITNSSFFIQI